MRSVTVLAQAVDHRGLGDRVERGGRLVENLNRRGPEVQASERQALPLAARQLASARKQSSQHRLVALWQIVDDLDRAGFLAGTLNRRILLQSVSAAEADVLAGGHLILAVVLKDDAHLALHAARAEASSVDAVQQNAACRRFEQAGHAA